MSRDTKPDAIESAIVEQLNAAWTQATGGTYELKKPYPAVVTLGDKERRLALFKVKSGGVLYAKALDLHKSGYCYTIFKVSGGRLKLEGTQNLYGRAPEVVLQHVNEFNALFTAPAPAPAPAPSNGLDPDRQNIEEARNALAVDHQDYECLTDALLASVHPDTGRKLQSEGERQEVLTEHQRLEESIAGAAEVCADPQLLALVQESIARGEAARASSRPILAVGAELAAVENLGNEQQLDLSLSSEVQLTLFDLDDEFNTSITRTVGNDQKRAPRLGM